MKEGMGIPISSQKGMGVPVVVEKNLLVMA
jgi:hypothetical protein